MDFPQLIKKFEMLKQNGIDINNKNKDSHSKTAQKATNITIQYNQNIFFEKCKDINEDMSKFSTATFNNNSFSQTLITSDRFEHLEPLHNMIINKNPFLNKRPKKIRSLSNTQGNNDNGNDAQLKKNRDNDKLFPGLSKGSSTASSLSNNRDKSNLFIDIKKIAHRCNSEASLRNNRLLFIPCINCGSNVLLEDIEYHSSKCTKVTQEILRNDGSISMMNSINYKLEKLKEHLLNISNGIPELSKEIENEYKYISIVLLRYIDDSLLLNTISLSTIKKTKVILKNLKTLGITNKTSLTTLILIDRTKVLVNEKIKIIKKSLKKKSIKGKSYMDERINAKLKHIEHIKLKTELEKTKVKNLRKSNITRDTANRSDIDIKSVKSSAYTGMEQNISQNDISININDISQIKIDDIVSDIENNNNYKEGNDAGDVSMISDHISLINYSNNSMGYIDNKINHDNPAEKELIIFDNLKEKKNFFKELLRIKFEKLHSTHKGLSVPKILVWEECMKNQIPKEKWKVFILNELRNPEKYDYIIKQKIKKNNKKEYMTIIDEEKM